MIFFLTTLISLLGGIVGGVITLFFKTILDKESHKTNKFYEYRADVILKLHDKMYNLNKAISIVSLDVRLGLNSRNESLTNAKEQISDFSKYYREKKLLLSQTLIENIESYLALYYKQLRMTTSYHLRIEDKPTTNLEADNNEYYMSVKMAEEDLEKTEAKNDNEIPPLIEKINNEFGILIGKHL